MKSKGFVCTANKPAVDDLIFSFVPTGTNRLMPWCSGFPFRRIALAILLNGSLPRAHTKGERVKGAADSRCGNSPQREWNGERFHLKAFASPRAVLTVINGAILCQRMGVDRPTPSPFGHSPEWRLLCGDLLHPAQLQRESQ